MSHNQEIIEHAKKVKVGWYSAQAEKNGNDIYIYTLADTKEEVRVITVTTIKGNKPVWKDAKCVGVVEKHLRTEKQQQHGTLSQYGALDKYFDKLSREHSSSKPK